MVVEQRETIIRILFNTMMSGSILFSDTLGREVPNGK